MEAATGEYPAYNNKCNEEINEAIKQKIDCVDNEAEQLYREQRDYHQVRIECEQKVDVRILTLQQPQSHHNRILKQIRNEKTLVIDLGNRDGRRLTKQSKQQIYDAKD